MRKYLLFILATMVFSLGLALAQTQPSSYPPGTTFTLENAQGNILWTNGQPPKGADLNVATKLVVTLPDGTNYTYQVSLKGFGQSLGEVMVSLANGQPVSFEAMLHSHRLEMTSSGKVVGNNQGAAGNGEHRSGKPAKKVEQPEHQGKSSQEPSNNTGKRSQDHSVSPNHDSNGD